MNGSVKMVSEGPLAGWYLLLSGARTFLGKGPQFTTPDRLEPCYEFTRQYQQLPNGQLAIAMVVTPILLLPSVTKLDVPAGGILLKCWELSPAEQKDIKRALDNGQEQIKRQRAAESGLVL